MSFDTLDGQRFTSKPGYSLKSAAACRELAEVRPSITPWGSAMQVAEQHQAEIDAIAGQALRAVLS
jgi:hypothetical protein